MAAVTSIITVSSTDLTPYLVAGGFQWENNDVDSPDSGRDLNGTMRRQRVTTKAKITLNFRRLTEAQLNTVITATKPETVSVTYRNPASAANRTANFYSSSIKAGIPMVIDGNVYYDGISLSLIEV